MDGLLKLRQSVNKKWPGQWLWRWAFDPDAILCQEFAYFLAGEDVPFSLSYCVPNPAGAPYKVYDTHLPEFQSKVKGPRIPYRRSDRTPSPARNFVPDTTAAPVSPLKRGCNVLGDVDNSAPVPALTKAPPKIVSCKTSFIFWLC